jgi:diacylglycerol O-acyltransferase-1
MNFDMVNGNITGGSNNNKNGNGKVSESNSDADSSDSSTKSIKSLPHYRPIHLSAHDSLLSPSPAFNKTDEKHGSLSFSGFRNLAMIVLVTGNLRLLIENYINHGIIRSFYNLGFAKEDLYISGLLTASIPVHLLISLLVERFAIFCLHKKRALSGVSPDATKPKLLVIRKKYLWKLFGALHALNAMAALCITSLIVYTRIFNPLLGTLCEVHAIILGLKVVSYALTNRDLRDAYLISDRVGGHQTPTPIPEIYKSLPYPKNLSIGNLIYFWWAPTLVYQPVYPRSPAIRPTFVFQQLVELFGTIMAIWFLSSQYALPILQSSLVHLHDDGSWITMAERLLKLAVVSIVIWLLGFFAVFQSSLNILAELMRFSDREFYLDWWNAGSVGSYWRLWNKPVNNYFVRHLYIPMLKLGWRQNQSSVMVFFVSAVLHEVLVGIPTHNVIGFAFLSMILQIPLVFATAPLEKMKGKSGPVVGNFIFWLSFFLGQPLGVMLYYLAWQLKFSPTASTSISVATKIIS